MKATFETREFGTIEVTRTNDGGDWSGEAYFKRGDYLVTVNNLGRFHDLFRREFQVLWPFGKDSPDAILEVVMPKELARSKVA